jgi:hypothetical protein
MTQSTCRHSGTLALATALLIAVTAGIPAAARSDSRDNALISGEMLQALLPSPDGWTRVGGRIAEVSISDRIAYTYADAQLTRDAMRMRVTVADSDGAADVLSFLATMVVTLPDDFTQVLKPATTITRSSYKTWPAAERWDGAQLKGDLTVVVAGRFVVSVEGSGLDLPQRMFEVIGPMDLKALAALR